MLAGVALLLWGTIRALGDERERLIAEAERLTRREIDDRRAARQRSAAIELEALLEKAGRVARGEENQPPVPTAPADTVFAVYDATGSRLWPLFPRVALREDVRAEWPADDRVALRAAEEANDPATRRRLFERARDGAIHGAARAAAKYGLGRELAGAGDAAAAQRLEAELVKDGIAHLAAAEAMAVFTRTFDQGGAAPPDAAALLAARSLLLQWAVADPEVARGFLGRLEASTDLGVEAGDLTRMARTWGRLPWRLGAVAKNDPARADLPAPDLGAVLRLSAEGDRQAMQIYAVVDPAVLVVQDAPQVAPAEPFPWRTTATFLLIAGSLVPLLGGLYLASRAVTRRQRENAARAAFLATTAHQLKTPVANLRLFVETLHAGRAEGSGERRRIEEILMLEAGRLGDYLDRLLAYQRLETNGARPREVVDIVAIVRQAIERWRKVAEVRGLGFDAEVGDAPLTAMGDGQALREALQNVLDNAVRLSRPGGRVRIVAGRDGPDVVIRVQDEGPGVPEEDRARLFQPFFSGSVTRSRGEGTGLGLAIARAGARTAGGTVVLERTGPSGSTFTFRIPFAKGSA